MDSEKLKKVQAEMKELYSKYDCERQLIQWGLVHIDLAGLFSQEEVDSFLLNFQKLRNDHTNTLHGYSVDVHKSSFPHAKVLAFCEPWIKSVWEIPEESLHLHGGFIIKYGAGGDSNLKLHVDDSDITINFCLFEEECEGSQIRYYGKMATAISKPQVDIHRNILIQPRAKWALIHLGSHQHETMPIIKGIRWNVVLWYKKKM